MSSFWTYKNVSGRDFLIAQNVRIRCFLNPAPTEFLTIAACSHNMFRSRDFRVHSFKHSNIVYHFGASGSRYLYVVYLNIFEWAFALFTFAITRTLCKGSTSYKIRYLSMSSGSVEQKILKHGLFSHLSLFSTCDQSNLTPAALVVCRVAKSAFSPQNFSSPF